MVGELSRAPSEFEPRSRLRPGQSNKPASRSQRPLRYVVIDSHPLSREGLCHMLAGRFPRAQIDRHAAMPSDKAQMAELFSADAILLVAKHGQKAIKDILAELSRSNILGSAGPVILLSEEWDLCTVKLAIAQGIKGCVSLASNVRVVTAVVNLVTEGGTYVPPESLMKQDCCANARAHDAELKPILNDRAPFTPQEQRVLSALLEGKSNKRIARDLELCESTVKVHVRHIMRKMSVTNRTQVALNLMRDGVDRHTHVLS